MSKTAKSMFTRNAQRLCTVSLAVVLAASALMTGCASTPAANTSASDTTAAASTSTGVKDINLSAFDLEYTDRDKDASYDEATAVKVSLQGATAQVEGNAVGVTVDGSTVTISKEGVYVLSGTLDDGQIVVECNKDDKAKVQIVLNGVSITNNDGPAIRVNQAKKCFITLPAGSSNTLTDGADYTLDQDSDEPYATLYSKDDLTLQGSGSLTVNGNYRHGIACKDNLVITGGTYNVTAVEDAVRGNDSVKVCDGVLNLTSGEDAIKANNDQDATAGFVSIDGGSLNISAGDDGIHAETALIVNAGTVSVTKSNEGLEAQQVYVNGGNIDVVASDDGINASAGSSSDSMAMGMADRGQNHKFEMPEGQAPSATGNTAPTGAAPTNAAPTNAAPTNAAPTNAAPEQRPGGPGAQGGMAGGPGMTSSEDMAKILLKVTGGTLHVNAGGDGLDSNGNLEITGGTIVVDGPTSGGDGALDYNGTATISGGTIIAVGSSGMAEGFTGGTQPFAMANVSGSAGSLVQLKDASGNVLASMTAAKQFSNVVVSAGVANGSTCTIEVDGNATQVTMSTEPTSNFGVQGFGGQGADGMKRRGA